MKKLNLTGLKKFEKINKEEASTLFGRGGTHFALASDHKDISEHTDSSTHSDSSSYSDFSEYNDK